MTARLLDDVAAGAAHLAAAVARFDKECRRNGLDPDRVLEALLRPIADKGGQRGTKSVKPKPSDQNVSMLMDPGTAAGLLGLSTRTLRRLVASGELPVVAVGTLRRFHRQDLTEFIQRRKEKP